MNKHGFQSEARRWFAWWPVRTVCGRTAWLRPVMRWRGGRLEQMLRKPAWEYCEVRETIQNTHE